MVAERSQREIRDIPGAHCRCVAHGANAHGFPNWLFHDPSSSMLYSGIFLDDFPEINFQLCQALISDFSSFTLGNSMTLYEAGRFLPEMRTDEIEFQVMHDLDFATFLIHRHLNREQGAVSKCSKHNVYSSACDVRKIQSRHIRRGAWPYSYN